MYKEILTASSFHLKLHSLPNTLFNGYEAKVNFTFVTKKDKSIIVKTQNLDKKLVESSLKPDNFPFYAYCEGFEKDFKKEVNIDNLAFVLQNLLFVDWGFNVVYKNSEPFITEFEAYTLGEKIGGCYNYWLKVLMDEKLQVSLDHYIKKERRELGLDKTKETSQNGFNISPNKKNKEWLKKFFEGMSVYFDENMDVDKAITAICANQTREAIRDRICVQIKNREPNSDDIVVFAKGVQVSEAYLIFRLLKDSQFDRFPVEDFFNIGRSVTKSNTTPLQSVDKKNEIEEYFNKIKF
ncbi:MAG: hypothetical protein JW717_04300 [Marinilabiliaceae bacterium]|nr:hypothetical protein [Marinilabiliaceae bacterium]MBN2819095.1 hypothetical protein [Bacteroidales bacterium]